MELFQVFLVISQREKMNNLVEVCLVGLGVGAHYARWLVLLYLLYFFCNTESSFRENTSNLV